MNMDIEHSLKITSTDNNPNIDRYSLYIKYSPLNKIDDFLILLKITDKILYDKLSNERLMISTYGYVLGFILSLFIIYYNRSLKREKLNNVSLVCIVVSTCFLTNYFYYSLTPKSDWMLNHITNGEQSKLWLEMYKKMSFYYHSGLVLGIIAVGFLAFAFRC